MAEEPSTKDTGQNLTEKRAKKLLELAFMVREFITNEKNFHQDTAQLVNGIYDGTKLYQGLKSKARKTAWDALSTSNPGIIKALDLFREPHSPFGKIEELDSQLTALNKAIAVFGSKTLLQDASQIEEQYKKLQEIIGHVCKTMKEEAFRNDAWERTAPVIIGQSDLKTALGADVDSKLLSKDKRRIADYLAPLFQGPQRYELFLTRMDETLEKLNSLSPSASTPISDHESTTDPTVEEQQQAQVQAAKNSCKATLRQINKARTRFTETRHHSSETERRTLGKRFSGMVDRVRGRRRTQSAPNLSTSSTSNKASTLPTKPRAMSVGDVTEGKSTDDGKTSQNDERDCKKPGPR